MNRLLTLTLAAVAVAAFTASSHAALILTQSTWIGDVDMTAQGTADWVVWDTGSIDKNKEWTAPISDARVEKAGGTAIGALTKFDAVNPSTQAIKDSNNDLAELSWTNGDAPTTGAATQGLRTGLETGVSGNDVVSSFGDGFTFDVTAGPASQTLYVYTGTFNAGGTFRAILKDDLGDEIDSVIDSTALTGDKGIWEVTFSDASAETLTIEWENTTDSGNFDNVQIFGAALIPEPASLALLGVGGLVMLRGRRRRA